MLVLHTVGVAVGALNKARDGLNRKTGCTL